MIRPSASVAIGVRDRAIQIASTITATALTSIKAIWAIWLSFWNQPKLMPTFQASTRSKNGVTLTAPRWAMSNTNSSQSFDAWSRISTAIAAMMPGRRWELRTRSMPDTYRAFFVLVVFFVFFAFAAETFFAPFLAVFLVTFFAAFCFAGFFLAPFVAAAFLAAFLAACFLAGAFLLAVVADFFSAGFFVVAPVVFVLSLLADILFVGTATSTGCFSMSCCPEISGSGSLATASTTRTGAGTGATGAADACSSAFHSRSARASRGDTSGYSGSSPTVGRIFHDRAHLLPTAFSTTTATPGTSFSRNASDGASSLVTIAFEVMQTSARSMSNRVPKILVSETFAGRDASGDERMFLGARSTSI